MNYAVCGHVRRGKVCFTVVAFMLIAASGLAPAAAQGTGGSIFGHGPAGAEIIAVSSTGAQRHATINAKGRYIITPAPMGAYTVNLQKDKKTVDARKNVSITVGRGVEVDFACPNDNCSATE